MEDPDDIDDPDFHAAIQASLQECGMSPSSGPTPASRSAVVDLTNDSDSDLQEVFPKSRSVVSSDSSTAKPDDHGYDDDELQRALELSVAPSGSSPVSKVTPRKSQPIQPIQLTQPTQPTQPSTPFVGLSGLDRKKMEEERLARRDGPKIEKREPSSSTQLKRKAEESPGASALSVRSKPRVEPPSPVPQSAQAMPEVVDLESLVLSPQSAQVNQAGRSTASAKNPQIATPSNKPTTGRPPTVQPASNVCRRYDSNAPDVKVRPTSRPILQWPLGTIKKTHIAGYPRVGNEITIEEVIQRDGLSLGIFSGFMWDMEWFFRKLNTSSTRFILIMQAKEQETVSAFNPPAA